MNSTSQSFLGRYRLVKVLGQGAMGVVYEGVDTRLNRTVAIKTVLRSHLADETTANEYATRFEREAQAAARLSHPHVVTVYDFGEHEDISYIVMEFVRGRELNQAFEAGEKFSLPETVRIMRELLLALDYAHQQGIVHRDVKPANVMLDGAGRVKLTDFGVARVTNANQDRTMPGTLVGTPSYMSPEQILGLAVGSRTDIFAAGVILYQFLVGRRPFTGGGPFGVQRKIVQDDPDPPSRLNPAVPQGFDIIIARALAKQPEKRYDSAAAFAADLERIGVSLPRAVPLIDLDLPDAPRETAPPSSVVPLKPPQQPPAQPPPLPQAAPAYDPAGPTLFTHVPFANAPARGPGATPAPASASTFPSTPAPPSPPAPPAPTAPAEPPPPFDPEATIIMFRPSGPPPAQPVAPPPPRAPAAAPAALSTPATATAPVRIATPEMLTVRPASVPTAPPAPSAPHAASTLNAPGASSGAAAGTSGRPPTPLPPVATPGPARTGRTPAPAPVARSPATTPSRPTAPAAAAGRGTAARPNASRRRLLPLAAAGGVAVLLLVSWLWVARPWSSPQAAPPAPAAAVTTVPDPAPPAPVPVNPTTATVLGDTATPTTTPTAAPGATPPADTAVVRPGPAADPPRPTPTATPPARTTEPAPVRRPPPATVAAPQAAPTPRPEPASPTLAPRCTDLLQRMQLGEPLTPEQTSYFQTRCTR